MTYVKFNQKPVARGFDNLFNEVFGGFPATWSNPYQGSRNIPAANVYETPASYKLELNAPGRNKEDFKINIEKELLTISYEKKEETKTEGVSSVRNEFSFNSFKRSFSLDEKIDASNIQAKYENGILKIELPKKEVVKEEAKQIAIS